MVTEALTKMKGKIHEIAGSHITSRVLQTCVKHCSQAERDEVFEELRPHFLTLAYNAYAVHLVKKMLDNASKKQLAGFISTLRGHVAPLLRHMVGSVVVEHAYDLASAAQKQELILELYSTELQLFKDLVSAKET
ncbi:Pumilio 24, variant 2, partial [Lathyrus oleraceus]